MVICHLQQVLHVASVNVLLVASFELPQGLVVEGNQMRVPLEEAGDDWLTFVFETDEGKDLINDVGLGVFLGVFSSYWHLRLTPSLSPTSEVRILTGRRGRDGLLFVRVGRRTGLLEEAFVIR
jgi:hypothetical protein